MTNQNQNKVLKLGLVKGEYTVPLDGYVLNKEIKDFDLPDIGIRVYSSMEDILYDHIHADSNALSPYWCYLSDVDLHIYINKITPETTPEVLEILKWCTAWKVLCHFWYYNCKSGTYELQEFFV